MIKKAVLLSTLTPFLMVFSDYSFAWRAESFGYGNTTTDLSRAQSLMSERCTSTKACWLRSYTQGSYTYYMVYTKSLSSLTEDDLVEKEPIFFSALDDDECNSENGSSINVSPSSANYLQTGGSVKTHGGACSISASSSVSACYDAGGGVSCTLDIVSESTGELRAYIPDSPLNGAWGEGDGTFSVVDFSGNDYLNP